MAEWFMEGLLRALLNPHHGLSKELLKQAVFYIVRLLCPHFCADYTRSNTSKLGAALFRRKPWQLMWVVFVLLQLWMPLP